MSPFDLKTYVTNCWQPSFSFISFNRCWSYYYKGLHIRLNRPSLPYLPVMTTDHLSLATMALLSSTQAIFILILMTVRYCVSHHNGVFTKIISHLHFGKNTVLYKNNENTERRLLMQCLHCHCCYLCHQ